MLISIKLNNKIIQTETTPGKRLIDWLRDDMGLTGTKEGCGEGECGACTVLLDGKPINSCLVLTGQVNGHSVTTIEGVRDTAHGKQLIESFVRNGAIQCGFCTPGMIMALYPIDDLSDKTTTEIRHSLAGNICRCTGYQKIIDAVLNLYEEIDG